MTLTGDGPITLSLQRLEGAKVKGQRRLIKPLDEGMDTPAIVECQGATTSWNSDSPTASQKPVNLPEPEPTRRCYSRLLKLLGALQDEEGHEHTVFANNSVRGQGMGLTLRVKECSSSLPVLTLLPLYLRSAS